MLGDNQEDLREQQRTLPGGQQVLAAKRRRVMISRISLGASLCVSQNEPESVTSVTSREDEGGQIQPQGSAFADPQFAGRSHSTCWKVRLS